MGIDDFYKVGHVHMRKSRTSKTCECCGKEIPKGDYYWNWKPLPDHRYWYAWRYRCLDCKPKYYNEHLYIEDPNAHLTQINRIAHKSRKKVANG